MNKRVLGWTVGLAGFCAVLTSYGALSVAVWDLDSAWTGGASATINASGYSSVVGTPTLLATANSKSTIQNLGSPDHYLRFYQDANGNHSLGGDFILRITAAQSLNTFSITYDAQTSATGGAANNLWQYSLNNGTSWTTIKTEAIGTAWGSHTVDLNISLAANATIWFRDTLQGGGSKGTADFNNITVTAVPEPVNVALGVFGLCAIGVGAGRRYLAKAKSKV
jgi:hypothetical protein